jgi:hypothetical protein
MLTRRRVLAFALAELTVPVLVAASSRESRAQGAKPRVEIVVLYAKKDPSAKGPQMGPGVPKLPQLSQAPFTGYNTFAFVGQTTLMLDAPKPADPWKGKPSGVYMLATGKPLQIALLDQLPDKRFHMGATIGKDSPDVLRWDAPGNEPVFIAGQSYKDGILVIGITLRAQPQ